MSNRHQHHILERWTSNNDTDIGDIFHRLARPDDEQGGAASRAVVQRNNDDSSDEENLVDQPLSPKSVLSFSSMVNFPSTPSYAASIVTTSTDDTIEASTFSGDTAKTPALSTGATAPSSCSFNTNDPTPILGVRLLDPDSVELADRTVEMPHFICCFFFLSCNYGSDDKDEWKEHCLSHFRGCSPPKQVQCPLCPVIFTHATGRVAWDAKMEHVAEHLRNGDTSATVRPDFALFKYLWQQRLINDLDWQELNSNYHLSSAPSHYVVMGGGRDERRRRPEPRPVVTMQPPRR